MMLKKIVLFLILNFGALGLGSYFTSSAVKASWYLDLNKAPWTPPGWFFGFAWTLIMICFAFYMAKLITTTNNRKKVILLFALQWVLNVSWNPVFFSFKYKVGGLIAITALTLLIAYFFIQYIKDVKRYTIFLAPYLLWLIVATSLNAYIVLYN